MPEKPRIRIKFNGTSAADMKKLIATIRKKYNVQDITIQRSSTTIDTTATSSFEREGYTILWVTRTTLKTDIWKNMFNQICHTIIEDRVRDGLVLPDDESARKRLLSKNWLQPISYKQFSNLLDGKNDLYNYLKARNGSEDVIKKTLIIIDEAHKLYGGDLKTAERPNMNTMERFLANSYAKSGKESARLLIMTATPFTNSPMELFQLINLCIEHTEEKIPDNLESFKKEYMNEEDVISVGGVRKLANKLSGYISYLNREKDPTQFAQPIMIEVPVAMSVVPEELRPFMYKEKSTKTISEEQKNIINEYKDRLKTIKNKKAQIKEDIKNRKKTLKAKLKQVKDDCKSMYPGRKEAQQRKDCIAQKSEKEEREFDLGNTSNEMNEIDNELKSIKESQDEIKKSAKELLQKIRNEKKVRTKYQDVMLKERCNF
jgi:hypothetical protein